MFGLRRFLVCFELRKGLFVPFALLVALFVVSAWLYYKDDVTFGIEFGVIIGLVVVGVFERVNRYIENSRVLEVVYIELLDNAWRCFYDYLDPWSLYDGDISDDVLSEIRGLANPIRFGNKPRDFQGDFVEFTKRAEPEKSMPASRAQKFIITSPNHFQEHKDQTAFLGRPIMTALTIFYGCADDYRRDLRYYSQSPESYPVKLIARRLRMTLRPAFNALEAMYKQVGVPKSWADDYQKGLTARLPKNSVRADMSEIVKLLPN
jgi:hypothetical protein